MDKKNGIVEFIKSLYLEDELVLGLCTCLYAREEGVRGRVRKKLEKNWSDRVEVLMWNVLGVCGKETLEDT
jgi:hypothetical protein